MMCRSHNLTITMPCCRLLSAMEVAAALRRKRPLDIVFLRHQQIVSMISTMQDAVNKNGNGPTAVSCSVSIFIQTTSNFIAYQNECHRPLQRARSVSYSSDSMKPQQQIRFWEVVKEVAPASLGLQCSECCRVYRSGIGIRLFFSV